MPTPPRKGGDNASANEPEDLKLAAELARKKLNNIYGTEPEAKEELVEIKTEHHKPSVHQQYLIDLQSSGKTMVEVQTAWHEYYLSLSNDEKNAVWKEFYASDKKLEKPTALLKSKLVQSPVKTEHATKVLEPLDEKTEKKHVVSHMEEIGEDIETTKKTSAEVKKDLIKKVQKRTKSTWFERFHSLIFGLAVGFCVLLIFLFSFFNDRFIAPFITPSRNVSAQSLIIGTGANVGPNPVIIIPKINVEIPVVYTVATTDENQIENSLEDGVVHYPTTAYPGQNGNGAIFGHSSNNILNPGKYKFAFVLLHDLQVGDTFTLDYQGTAYVYQIFQRQIVPPSDVNVLNNIPGHTATFTLITCDPPGTSINRLVVVGDQISPTVASNTAGPNQNTAPKPTTLPSNSPSLWSRFTSWL